MPVDVQGKRRDPDHLKILPGLSVIVAPTDSAAEADHDYLQSLIHPIVGREILSTMLGGIDLSPYPLDGPMPELPPSPSGSRGHYEGIVAKARKEKLTIRQLGAWCAGARGKNAIYGSAKKVADYVEEWFVKGACDGFCAMPPYIPGAHDDFAIW